ncbi:MAG TPA: magnesium/cobalt transporter CorA [bacterium]|nr:magnesium/cobalt transporter CorA [bacterium]
MIEIIYYNGQTAKDLSVQEFENIYPIKEGFVWIDFFAPSSNEIKKILVDLFHFHHLTIEDLLVFTDHPKLDEYDDYLFGIFHSIVYHENEMRVATWEIDFYLGNKFIITNHLKPIIFLPTLKNKFRNKNEIILKGPEFILQNLLLCMVESYFPVLNYIYKKLDETENEVFTVTQRDTINDIYKMKRNLSIIKRVLIPQMEIFETIDKLNLKYISEESKFYFNDILGHLEKINSMVDNYIDMAKSTLDAHLSISSYKMNQVMKTLTIITTIVMPLTLIAGIYGMNFEHMPELKMRYAYFVVLGVMLIIAIVLTTIFKKKKWF